MLQSKRYKILFCIRQGSIGGGESHLIDLVEFLDTTKFQPFILSFTDGAMMDHFKKRMIDTFVIPSEKPFDTTIWAPIAELLEKVQPHLIHIHGTRAFSNLLWPLRKKRIPVVYTIHGWSFNSGQPFVRRKVATLAERLFTKRADININVSYSNQETGKQAISNFESMVIRNGVNISIFDKGKTYPHIREELGIPANAFLVGFIARMTVQKDPLTLIRAFAMCASTHPHMHLLMVGDGELKPAARALAAELSLSNRIIFEGFRKDIPAVLKCIDVYCLPSLWEGFSIGLLEAMAMEKPVIASAVDGTRELLQHNINSLLVAPGNVKQLALALSTLNDDKVLRHKLKQNGFQAITQEFNAARVARKVGDVYCDLLEVSR